MIFYLVEDGLQYLGCDGVPMGLDLGQPIVVLHQDAVPFQTLTMTELQGMHGREIIFTISIPYSHIYVSPVTTGRIHTVEPLYCGHLVQCPV